MMNKQDFLDTAFEKVASVLSREKFDATVAMVQQIPVLPIAFTDAEYNAVQQACLHTSNNVVAKRDSFSRFICHYLLPSHYMDSSSSRWDDYQALAHINVHVRTSAFTKINKYINTIETLYDTGWFRSMRFVEGEVNPFQTDKVKYGKDELYATPFGHSSWNDPTNREIISEIAAERYANMIAHRLQRSNKHPDDAKIAIAESANYDRVFIELGIFDAQFFYMTRVAWIDSMAK